MARRGKAYKWWRSSVYKRDNYTCQSCFRSNVYLNAHHINPWSRFYNQRYSVDNGITFCGSCHQQFHELFGVDCGIGEVLYFIESVTPNLLPAKGRYGGKRKYKKRKKRKAKKKV